MILHRDTDPQFENNIINEVHVDTRGHVWMNNGGFACWDGGATDTDWLTLDGIGAISQAPDGMIWAQNQNELVEVDPNTRTGTIRGAGYTGNNYSGPFFTSDGAV